MLKSIIKFFRKKNIKENLQRERMMQFPDFEKYLTITLMIDDSQKKIVKEMDAFVKNAFNSTKVRFVVMTKNLQSDFLQSDTMFFLEKTDFNIFGVLKKEKEEALRSFFDDMFINLSNSNNELLNDYLVTCVNSKFKIGHSKNNTKLHDLIIDYGIETDDVERLKILHKYLKMLSGSKDEK